MPFDIGDTLDRIETYLSKSGHIRGGQQIGAYTQPPDTGQGPAAFITMTGTSVVEITLAGNPIEQHVVMITILLDALREPASGVEKDLAVAASNVLTDLLSEYDLGGSIRNVDPAGMHGTGFTTRWGYLEISNKMYRIVDITIPLVVDWTDSAAA
jgi:hypothetical protein